MSLGKTAENGSG